MKAEQLMSSVVFRGGDIVLETVPVPSAESGQILVRVAAVGICGTDLHILGGDHVTHEGDLIPGHEFSGTVHAIGEGVAGFSHGDPVVVNPNIPCQACRYCERGKQNLCESYEAIGVTLPGAAAQYVVVPVGCVEKLPSRFAADTTLLENAAIVEPLSCAVHGMDVLGQVLGDDVLVYGAGTMGLMMIDLLHRSGAGTITVIDLQEEKARRALDLGATHVAKRLSDVSGEDRQGVAGWDVVVDCTGVPAVIAEGLNQVGRGGRFLQFGVAPSEAEVPLSPYKVYRDEITILGSMAVHQSFGRAAELLAVGLIDPTKYVSHRFPLVEYGEALSAFRRGETIKALVIPDRSE